MADPSLTSAHRTGVCGRVSALATNNTSVCGRVGPRNSNATGWHQFIGQRATVSGQRANLVFGA